MAKRDKKKMIRVALIGTDLKPTPEILREVFMVKPRRGGFALAINLGEIGNHDDAFRANGGTSITDLIRQAYDSLDTDTEMLRGVTKELLEATLPVLKKSDGSRMIGVPMIFGTGGGHEIENYKRMAMGNFDFQDLFIPATHVIGPSMREQLNESINRGEYVPLEEIVRKMSRRKGSRQFMGYINEYPFTPEQCFKSTNPMARLSAANKMENNLKITSISTLPHEQRVIVEANELGIKTHNLSVFINTNPIFEKLSSGEAERLTLQYNLMKSYFEILEKRIEHFSGLIAEEFIEKTTPELTFGQKLVGLNFNPSGDDSVGQVKQKFADVADIIGDPATDIERRSWTFNAFRTYALTTLLGAQMAVVKLLTFRD